MVRTLTLNPNRFDEGSQPIVSLLHGFVILFCHDDRAGVNRRWAAELSVRVEVAPDEALPHNRVPWVPDEEASVCISCKAPFTSLRRRHHCRCCGEVFCGGCSDHQVDGARACSACFFASVQQSVLNEAVELSKDTATAQAISTEGGEQLQVLSIASPDTSGVHAPSPLWPLQPSAPEGHGGQTQPLVAAVWENQRCPASELSPRDGNVYSAAALLPTERGPWTDAEGQRVVDVHEDPPPPTAFAWATGSSWVAHPFEYAWHFDDASQAGLSTNGTWTAHPSTALGRKTWVRRRRWERAIVPGQPLHGAVPEADIVTPPATDPIRRGSVDLPPLELPPPPSYESVVETAAEKDAADVRVTAQQPFDEDLFLLVMSTPRGGDGSHPQASDPGFEELEPEPEVEPIHVAAPAIEAPPVCTGTSDVSRSAPIHMNNAGDGRPPPLQLQLTDPAIPFHSSSPCAGLTPGRSPCLATLYGTGQDPRPLASRDLRVRDCSVRSPESYCVVRYLDLSTSHTRSVCVCRLGPQRLQLLVTRHNCSCCPRQKRRRVHPIAKVPMQY